MTATPSTSTASAAARPSTSAILDAPPVVDHPADTSTDPVATRLDDIEARVRKIDKRSKRDAKASEVHTRDSAAAVDRLGLPGADVTPHGPDADGNWRPR